jgi:hypothetical protein
MPLLHQHAEREQQGEHIDRIEARETRQPEVTRLQLAGLGAVAVVVGKDEAGEQQKEADRGIAIIDDRRKRTEPLRVREMEEDDVERGKGAQAAEGIQARLLRFWV